MAIKLGISGYILVLVFVVVEVRAITKCDRNIIRNIMSTNEYYGCPNNILQNLQRQGTKFTFRTFAPAAAKKARCATGEIVEPPNGNMAVLRFTMTFKDPRIPAVQVNYTMVEARCGLFFKYVVEDSYTAYELAGAYMDSNAFGYYGCTDQDPKADGNLYIVCLAKQEDSPEVDRSVEMCKRRLQAITGHTNVVSVPHCTNG